MPVMKGGEPMMGGFTAREVAKDYWIIWAPLARDVRNFPACNPCCGLLCAGKYQQLNTTRPSYYVQARLLSWPYWENEDRKQQRVCLRHGRLEYHTWCSTRARKGQFGNFQRLY